MSPLSPLTPFGPLTRRNTHAPLGNGLLTSLTGFWKLDEASGTRLDQTAHHENLGDNNTVGQAVGLVYANAAQFDNASSRYLSRVSETALITGNDVLFAVSAWVYPHSLGALNGIISKDDNGPTREWRLYSDSSLAVEWDLLNSSNALITSTARLTADTWNLICAGFDGSLSWLSLNNGAKKTVASAHGARSGTSPLEVGRAAANLSWCWDGRIGPVSYWVGRSLSTTDIGNLWNGGAGLTYAAYS